MKSSLIGDMNLFILADGTSASMILIYFYGNILVKIAEE